MRPDFEGAPAPVRGEYVLGANAAELARLAHQHEVWGPVTDRLLDRVGVGAGWTCLDLGCGPGFVTQRLAQRVGARGRVDALDPSPVWQAHLARVVRERALENVRLLPSAIEDAVLEEGAYDLVLARWVLSFLPGVEALVARLARLLRPGGVLAVEDYNHEGISVFPPSEGFRAVVRATRALYASRGGDPWVAGRLPAAMRAAGLEVADPTPHVICGGPTSPAFRWADAFFPLHVTDMVTAGVLAPAERDLFLAEWEERKADPSAVFYSPIVVDVAGRRPA